MQILSKLSKSQKKSLSFSSSWTHSFLQSYGKVFYFSSHALYFIWTQGSSFFSKTNRKRENYLSLDRRHKSESEWVRELKFYFRWRKLWFALSCMNFIYVFNVDARKQMKQIVSLLRKKNFFIPVIFALLINFLSTKKSFITIHYGIELFTMFFN